MHPYEFLKKQNPNGLDQFVAEIRQRIVEVESYIVKFAEEAGQPELADKDTVYALFQRGVSENLVYGLHELFKHYYCIFKKQILNEMIEVHQFDKRDIEILKYFHDDFKFTKDTSRHIHFECPSMLVFETTFSIAFEAKATRYMNLFYRPMAYLYDTTVRAYGGTNQWNSSIKVDDLFVFDVPDNAFTRNIELKPITRMFDDHAWIRDKSEKKYERMRDWREDNKDKVDRYRVNFKTTRDNSSKERAMLHKQRGLIRIKVDGKFRVVNRSDVIIVYIEEGYNRYKYVLRSRATQEQIDYFDSHREDLENEFYNRYKDARKV